jgi:hypothetical protein
MSVHVIFDSQALPIFVQLAQPRVCARARTSCVRKQNLRGISSTFFTNASTPSSPVQTDENGVSL